MNRKACDIGDKVVLRTSAAQSALNSRLGVVVGLLPMDRGEARYRVRVEGETFERCVLATDIEHVEPATPEDRQAAPTGPWLKPLSTNRLGS